MEPERYLLEAEEYLLVLAAQACWLAVEPAYRSVFAVRACWSLAASPEYWSARRQEKSASACSLPRVHS